MHDDCPGVAAPRDRPGRHRAERVGNVHIGEAKAERLSWVARVDVGFDRDLHRRRQIAARRAQPPGHRVGIVVEHRANNGMPSLPVEPVDTRAFAVFGPSEDDLPWWQSLDLGVFRPARVVRN